MCVVVFLLQVAAGVQNSPQYLSPQVPDPHQVLRSPGPVFIVSLKKPPITNSRELFTLEKFLSSTYVIMIIYCCDFFVSLP